MLESEIDEGINVCCVISDSLRWDTFVNSKPLNILKLGRARKAYSISNSTAPAMHGYLMNYPPIGVGKGFFVHGEPDGVTTEFTESSEVKYQRWSSVRKWMPQYFRDHGYFTMMMSANPVLARVDRELGGAYRKHFNHWGVDDYVKQKPDSETWTQMDVATPQIIKDLNLHVKVNREQPIFAVMLLLDTHTPYDDGDGVTHLIDPGRPQLNYENQFKAMRYINNVFPNFINIFSKTERPTEFIFTSDHGENLGGPGWGHNSFRPALDFGENLFAIPFMRGRIEDWSRFKVIVQE